MKEKNKMHITFIVCLLGLLSIGAILYAQEPRESRSTIISTPDTQDASKSIQADQNDSALDNTSEEFVDTEGNNGEEMVIDEQAFVNMPSVDQELSQQEIETINVETTGSAEQTQLPEEVNLDVTFFPQAPDANWSLPWKEACEEASVIQAYYYVTGKELSKDTFRSEILSIVDVQENILGKYIDTSMGETAQFLEEYYDYTDYEIIDNPSIDDMKRELAQGHPIIAPFAGKELGNSFFTNGGPRYHVIVIVGYKDGFFITNDVGTSRGENFAYSQETIMDAMHDLVPAGEGDILDGDKRILVMK